MTDHGSHSAAAMAPPIEIREDATQPSDRIPAVCERAAASADDGERPLVRERTTPGVAADAGSRAFKEARC